MAITEEQVRFFARRISELYNHIFLGVTPSDVFYFGFLENVQGYGLDEAGYTDLYLGILREVFKIPDIEEKWSEDGIQQLGHSLLRNMAETKTGSEEEPDFTVISREWLEKIDVEPEEYTCYTSVVGLSVESPLELGGVDLLPVGIERPELEHENARGFLEHLNAFRYCLSCSRVVAEPRRATEIHRERTERALNILRFVGSLAWYEQQTRHINVAGQDITRLTRSIFVSSGGGVGWVDASEISPVPMNVNAHTLPLLQFYGLDEIQALFKNAFRTEIENSLLTGIEWYGRATQELSPLVAFVKHYIAIEAATKLEREYVGVVLPERIGALIEPRDRSRFASIKAEAKDLIDERNEVFHSGKPLNANPEELQWRARVLSRMVLHQLRIRLESESWTTKEDLKTWATAQRRRLV